LAVSHPLVFSRKETGDAKQAEGGLAPSANVETACPLAVLGFMRPLLA